MIEQSSWEQFLRQQEGNFLQSWSWGEFQKSLSKKVFRIRIKEKEVLAQAQIIEETLLFGQKFFYLPLGPTFNKNLSLKQKKEVGKLLLAKTRILGQKRKTVFLKIDPLWPLKLSLVTHQKTCQRIQPLKTLILNLELPLEDILKNFSERTRYNIRLAQKKGLEVMPYHQLDDKNQEYFSKFIQLIQSTSERKKFQAYDHSYYQKLLTNALSEKWGELFFAKYQGKIIGVYLMIFFNQQATCLHGAVDYHYRSLKVSHFLQWRQIQSAKERGCTTYDFWGIDEKRWPGVTFFKKSFRGQVIQYPTGIEIPWRRGWYSAYRMYQKIKK